MNKVIALKGRSNIGKTSTLKRFIELFKEKYSIDNAEYLIEGQDVRVVYTVGNIKIGIETQGDPYSRLPESLELFENEGCQLIVCACRSSGATVEAVKSLRPRYLASFRGQSSASLEEWRGRRDTIIASMLLEEISEVMNA